MGFTEFVPPERFTTDPKVLISKQGKITFNSASVKKWDLDKYNFVKLYFDKETGNLGFKFYKANKDEGDKGIVNLNKSNGVYVYSKTFLDAAGISYNTRSEMDFEYDKKHDMFIAKREQKKQKKIKIKLKKGE
ncbi:MAG: hypothetical protein RBR32_07805 [Bacteroidales bacterium]|nr:hypothetical protein [Bacteroidales bacterium]